MPLSVAAGFRASTMHSLKSKGDIYEVHASGFDDSEISAIQIPMSKPIISCDFKE